MLRLEEITKKCRNLMIVGLLATSVSVFNAGNTNASKNEITVKENTSNISDTFVSSDGNYSIPIKFSQSAIMDFSDDTAETIRKNTRNGVWTYMFEPKIFLPNPKTGKMESSPVGSDTFYQMPSRNTFISIQIGYGKDSKESLERLIELYKETMSPSSGLIRYTWVKNSEKATTIDGQKAYGGKYTFVAENKKGNCEVIFTKNGGLDYRIVYEGHELNKKGRNDDFNKVVLGMKFSTQ